MIVAEPREKPADPATGQPAQEGYAVTLFAGVEWMDKAEFEINFVDVDAGITFNHALVLMCHGIPMMRGKAPHRRILLVEGSEAEQSGSLYAISEGGIFTSFLAVTDAESRETMPWLPSNEDLFAQDWRVWRAA